MSTKKQQISILTVSEVADILGNRCESWVRARCARGEVNGVTRAGLRTWLIPPTAVEQFRRLRKKRGRQTESR
jgi:hypothetical protein